VEGGVARGCVAGVNSRDQGAGGGWGEKCGCWHPGAINRHNLHVTTADQSDRGSRAWTDHKGAPLGPSGPTH
jgi:hypothetical protein